MEALEEYFKRISREAEPSKKQIIAVLETEAKRGIAPLRSINEISKRTATGIVFSECVGKTEIEVLIQGGFLKSIGKEIRDSMIAGDILVITNLGRAAIRLLTRYGDSIANLNPEMIAELLMREFKIIND